jgi:DGQHR domain-containing protein
MSNSLKNATFSGHGDLQYMAIRRQMGGRWVYHLDLSIPELFQIVEPPTVGQPQEDNREVSAARCKAFARYLDENEKWGSPSLMLRCPEGTVRFEVLETQLPQQGIQIGRLAIPPSRKMSVRILDGQHRIGGTYNWAAMCNKQVSDAQEHLQRAKNIGETHQINQAQQAYDKALGKVDRLEKTYFGIDLIEVNDTAEAKQVFADIANNAKGMTKSLTTGFDNTKVVNRATNNLVEENPHPLLAGRVDWNKDRLAGKNEHLLSAKAVADVIRSTYVGVGGRVSRNLEFRKEDDIVQKGARRFFDVMMRAFPHLEDVEAPELRKSSLLGSSTMWRAFAGAWYLLTKTTSATGEQVTPHKTDDEVVEFFASLAPYLGVPIRSGNPWLTTGDFPKPKRGSTVIAPEARTQNLRNLSDKICLWAIHPEESPFG